MLRLPSLAAVVVFCLTLVVAPAPRAVAAEKEPVVRVGAGGYLTMRPKLCKPLPETIYKTAEVSGPMLTNQWWSSLVWQPYSQNLFAHPAVVRCSAEGLVVAYPGAQVHGNKTGIFGSADLKNGDFTIGHSTVPQFPRADCGGYSDWFVTAVMAHEHAALRASFGHGSPFVYCLFQSGEPRLTFAKPPQVWSGKASDAVLGITVNGHHYGLFGASGSTWSGLDGATFSNRSQGKTHFSVAVLPDDRPETLTLFARYAHAHVTDTLVEHEVVGGTVRATYRFVCTPREGTETQTLFALYPHQWKYTTSKLTDLSYGSVRGVMKLGVGERFTTEVIVQGVLPALPRAGIANRERMLGYLQAEAKKSPRAFADSYWDGKYLGTLASLSGIAEVVDAPELRATFIAELKRRLESWFTATPLKEQPVFYYDQNWGALVGSRPGFGSDMPLNDHHFHYGYFIRAAAEVARVDADWARQWGPMVELLIRDIASHDRRDALFPYLRCFDKYAGHSWASGDANFADGNNQESSSESLNAWYGVMLWGEATDNRALRDLGIYLFNVERTAVEEYWFDVAGTNYPRDFPQVALGMVWGGKGAFGTWFSGEIDCIHGINWLPFTPASLSMGRNPDYVRKNFERIVAERKGGRDFSTGWGDLVLMFGALHDPAPAVAYLAQHPQCKLEEGNSHAFMDHWIHTLNTLGHVDATTTSAHPFTTVFVQGGQKTYAAYNSTAHPVTVEFSDGRHLAVPARSIFSQTFATPREDR